MQRFNDTAPVMRADGDLIELMPMDFGLPPSGPEVVPSQRNIVAAVTPR